MYNIIVITFQSVNNKKSNVNRTQSGTLHESRVHLQRRRPTANENDGSG